MSSPLGKKIRRNGLLIFVLLAAGASLTMLGCSTSGDHSAAGSGPFLLRAVIIEPTQDLILTEADNLEVTFKGTHTGGNPDGEFGYTWTWVDKNFGPRSANGQNLTFQFFNATTTDSSGEWVFTFTVQDIDGTKNSATIRVTVVEPKRM